MKINSVITWSLAIALLIFIYLSIYPSFARDSELLNDVLASFPEEFLIAFGMTDMDWSTILGFFGIVFLFTQICLSIQAANYGFSLVSVEETDLTADFLLAKPVGRTKILTSKLLAAITGLTITNLVVWISSFVFLRMYSEGGQFETKPVLLLMLSIVIFQLFFLTVGMLISLLVKRVRSVTPYSMALAFGMYVMNAFGGMIGEDKLEIISPFKHFDPSYILKNGSYDLPLVLISVVTIVISISGSYVLYLKRNIRSAV
ncbi:MAG: ABC transporter permease subunit [Anaerolineales bacterium]|nr:ABC transporter permease subunit [Anaerolineales bacterium]